MRKIFIIRAEYENVFPAHKRQATVRPACRVATSVYMQHYRHSEIAVGCKAYWPRPKYGRIVA